MPPTVPPTKALRIHVTGRVQGVGFRPFVYGLAGSLGLHGTVRNDPGGVSIELEGPPSTLDRFLRALREEPPPLARIEQLTVTERPALGQRGFRILKSATGGAGRPVLAPDTATCEACLRELRDPADRRCGYPFSNCTDCGPRLTILTGAPYDRERTTMAAFSLCAECRREYEDPSDRRYHAQPVACPACGPRLSLLRAGGGAPISGTEACLAGAVEVLRGGRVVAVKGLGGFHLACDARRPDAVRTLRRLKHRPDEPFALMVADPDAAREEAVVGAAAWECLTAPARPVVLCPRRARSDLAGEVAPGLEEVGLMLPYTPLHHLLFDRLSAEGAGSMPLVMTSANVHGEPMPHRDEDLASVRRLADVVLTSDRPIAIRCDDSVVRAPLAEGEAAQPLRLARGFSPLELRLPWPVAEPTVALGGHLKATFALADEDAAVVGPHVGDLDHPDAERSYEEILRRLLALYGREPTRLVVDAHPDYATRRIAERLGLPALEVWHHHAHVAACLAEHGVRGAAVGVAFDGAGLGPDGTIWGGEILAGDLGRMERVAHLSPVALPGGDRAATEPWRMALSHLMAAGLDGERLVSERVEAGRVRTVATMIRRSIRCPLTSSAGRLFDAAAWLAGVVDEVSYEAQAPMWLEAAARRAGSARVEPYPFELDDRGGQGAARMDPRPMWPALLEDVRRGAPVERVALAFHLGLAEVTTRAVRAVAERRGAIAVALCGGTFANAVLRRDLSRRLNEAGLDVYASSRLPPNDGALAFGQLAVRAALDHPRDHPRDEGR